MRTALPPRPLRPLLVSGQPQLVSAVLDRLPEPAHPDVVADVASARQRFGAAPRVLVGTDLLSSLAATGPARRSDVGLLLPVGAPEPDPRACIRLGIEQVLDVEEGARWLGSADAIGGRVVTVTGARGGCGASTLAAALALSAAAHGTGVLLVDLDLSGGGLDVLLGSEHLPGLRWPDLDSDSFDFAGLPAVGNLRVLSAGRDPANAPPELMRGVVTAAAGMFGLVVLDLPRGAPVELLPEPLIVLLVVPDEIRAGAAAAVRLAEFPSGADVRIVARDGVGGEPALETADRLGRPLAGRLRVENRLAEEAERGLVRPSRTRSPVWRLADRLAAELWAEAR